MRIRKITDVKNLKGKRVLVRVDFNVPVKDGQVKDFYKIEKSLPTIKYLLGKGAQVILMSHLGRPNGYDKKLSLAPVAKALEKILCASVILRPWVMVEGSFTNRRIDSSFHSAYRQAGQNDNKKIILLENVRFIPGEEKNNSKVAKMFAGLADIFVLDGFAVAHRDSASVTGVAKYLPAYAGMLLTEELSGLTKVVGKPKKPLVVVLGGVKCETKIPILNNFLKKADYILVGGGIASTYFWAQGQKVGASRVDKDFKKEILKICAHKKIILPIDAIVGKHDGSDARIVRYCEGDECKKTGLAKKLLGALNVFRFSRNLKLADDEAIYDIGPGTVRLFSKYIKKANTLVMNGALGYFEQAPYQHGTYAIARLFAGRSKGRAFGVAGGGETVQILQKLGIIDDIDLVSTGGGAMLEYLGGKKLPGVKAVTRKL